MPQYIDTEPLLQGSFIDANREPTLFFFRFLLPPLDLESPRTYPSLPLTLICTQHLYSAASVGRGGCRPWTQGLELPLRSKGLSGLHAHALRRPYHTARRKKKKVVGSGVVVVVS